MPANSAQVLHTRRFGSRVARAAMSALALCLLSASAGLAQETGWSAPQVQHAGNPQDLIEVDAAIDDAARIQVIHSRFTTTPTTRTVWAAQWTGTAWTAAQRLSPSDLAGNPALALDPVNGQGYASWGLFDAQLGTTIAESRFDGNQWLPQATPPWGTQGASFEGYNRLAYDRMRRMFALYMQNVGGRARAAGAVRSAGGWSAGTTLSTASGAQHSVEPALAVNAGGLAAAVWIDSDESIGRLQVSLGTMAGWSCRSRSHSTRMRARPPRASLSATTGRSSWSGSSPAMASSAATTAATVAASGRRRRVSTT